MIGRIVAVAATLLATPLSAHEYEPDCERIAAFLDSAVAGQRVAGASAMVWKDGEERCFDAAGVADREQDRPFARDTLVQFFSMTKPVTGVALMTLWEQGRFGLDDPLYWHLPEYEHVQVLRGETETGEPITSAPSRPITVRDILRHTAGFTYGADGNPQNAADRVWEELLPLSPDKSLAEFSQAMAKVPLLFDPGTHWSYSAGVDVQARLVEVLSGKPFAQYVEETIFDPLSMDGIGWPNTRTDLHRLATIYDVGPGGTFTPVLNPDWVAAGFVGKPMTMGGGGLVGTVDDYARFALMLLGEGALGDVRILRPATVRLMATDHLDPAIAPENRSFLPGKGSGGFGFDFFVRTAPPQTPEENRGSVGEFFWDGWPSMLFWVDPQQDMVVILATQKMPFDDQLHHDFRDAVYGGEYTGR
ncbi:serine hydrolase domain-containing protein [Qipengyuania sphaerica]|uniref:serine hydrolase domain-containing protein n=1 Tax=Qipengyuania sphaerica TaxID=2867243 RepID=UPI001C883F22|nr:serine hydrolase domain-containing protein [Qipengyuania sphaerica]MBX7539560.1 beta-lactamase family protein [Qipengyuania sphaerica]